MVGLRELLTQMLEPFLDPRHRRCELIGDEVCLTPEMAVSLGLAFHELITNACEHGALSVQT
jgi:two-component sensor histidine kinase